MAPVVQSQSNSNKITIPQDKTSGKKPARPELLCRVKYCNTLPDIPFDPKFIVYPFDTNRFVQYKQTSLEKNYKHDLLTEQDLGVSIDLINPETYEINDLEPRLSDEDEKLLEDEIVAPQDTKRSRCHNRAITWLKKTEYISTEFNRYGASSDKTETKVGFGVKKKMQDEYLYLDRQSQIQAINKTFESAKKPITSHPGKPGVKPVEVLPVFPDFGLWKYPFAQVMFDADPAPADKREEMEQAMIRGMMDESGEQFVAYFLPTKETIQKRKIDELEGREYTENEEYEFALAREYNWIVKNKATKGYEENYFFVFRDGVVCYNELETRVKLTKRRTLKNQQQASSKLVLIHRPLNEAEIKMQEIRNNNLEPPGEDEAALEAMVTNDNNAPEAEEQQDYSQKEPHQQEPPESADNNGIEPSDESEPEEEESKQNKSHTKRRRVSADKSSSQSSSQSSSSESDSDKKSSSGSNSSDDSDDDDDDDRRKQRNQVTDIFGDDSDSDD